MNGIRIKNMRSLKDTGEIVLKDINILVGNNSSGKSTFLRVFPLLKQSFIKRINGPILWAGEKEDDVDFGSFEETVNKSAEKKEIELEFDIAYNLTDIDKVVYSPLISIENSKRYNKNQSAKFLIGISKKDNKDIISKVVIEINDKKFLSDMINKKEYLNEKELPKFTNKILDKHEEITQFLWEKGEISEESSILKLKSQFDYTILFKKLMDKLIDDKDKDGEIDFSKRLMKEGFTKYILMESIYNQNLEIDNLWKTYKQKIKKDRNMLRRRYLVNLENIKLKTILNKDKKEIQQYIDLIYINVVAKYCLADIYKYFIKVNYIKPVRAYAERYYRLKNLSVNDIDSDGKNLPIFINSLSASDLRKFKEWTKENFGFAISTNQTEGHVSINVEVENRKVNLSDTGYGYSQLLPIITQLWVITSKINNENDEDIPIVFAVEQPELHLHPGLQAKLIDIIAKFAKNHKGRFQFILETHSETIINRIGNLIYKNKLDEKSVNVIVFDKKLQDANTQINISNYDEDGYLNNWPSGFFLVDEIK